MVSHFPGFKNSKKKEATQYNEKSQENRAINGWEEYLTAVHQKFNLGVTI